MNTLVLLPGWLLSERTYQKLINLAPNDYQVFIPGYDILAPKGDLTYFKDRLSEFLKKNKLSEFDLAGHSLGGGLALDFTYTHPQKVKNLYLMDAKVIHTKESISKAVCHMLEDFWNNGHLKLWTIIEVGIKIVTAFSAHFKIGFYARDINLEEEAKEIKVSTWIFWGEKDLVISLQQGERIHRLIHNSKFVVLKDMDHNWIIHSPEKFWENILDKNGIE